MRKGFVIFSILLFCASGFAQTTISGRVSDSTATPLSGAGVLIHNPGEEIIRAYSFTDKKGHYKLSFDISADTIVIEIQMLGYAKATLKLKNRTQRQDFKLKEQTELLPEILVKAPKPISQHGDTLIYKVSSFAQPQDRSIRDVIEHMPGIDIRDNGEIYYQGKPINKYYVENMDLLGGRYNLINDNLPGYEVEEVQILENHQPIKILDSVVHSDRAAINLKLKKKHVFTGQAILGAGGQPLLWKANVTPMMFTKDYQFLATYQTNNTGRNIAGQLKDFTGEGTVKTGGSSGEGWLGVLGVATPPFAPNRWLDNNAHLGSVNFLTKMNKDFELKGNLSYYNDYTRQEGDTKTNFFTPSDTISLYENMFNQRYSNHINGKISVEKNTENNYFKDHLLFNGSWNRARDQITTNAREISQHLSSRAYSLGNNFKMITRIGGQLLNLHSQLSLTKTPQRLKIFPGQFENLLHHGTAYERTLQDLEVKTLHTSNSAGVTKKIGRFSFSSNLGYTLNLQKLRSNLWTNQNIITDPAFANQMDWQDSEGYLDLKTQFHVPHWLFTIYTPLKFKSYSITDQTLQKKETLNRFVFDPRIILTRYLGEHLKMKASAQINHFFGMLNQFHYGYLMSNYRNIDRIDAPLPVQAEQSYQVGANYKNSLAGVFGNLHFSYRKTKRNLIYNSDISPQGALKVTAKKANNFSYDKNISAKITKYIFALETKLSINGRFSNNVSTRYLNEMPTPLKSTNYGVEVLIDSRIASWLNVKFVSGWGASSSKIQHHKQATIKTQVHRLKIDFHPLKKQSIIVKGAYFKNNLSTRSIHRFFGDLLYRFTWASKKIDFELHLINLFGSKAYHSIKSNPYSYVETSYALRPRQVLLSIRFGF